MEIPGLIVVVLLAAVAATGPVYLLMQSRIETLETVNTAQATEIQELRAQKASARELLQGLEWVSVSATIHPRNNFCPCCYGEEPHHRPGCELARLLHTKDGA